MKEPDGFIGFDSLKKKHRGQINLFESWAKEKTWHKFHRNHYDYLAYPISTSPYLGGAYMYKLSPYKLSFKVTEELKKDAEFLLNHRRGIQLGSLAWGWEIEKKQYVALPEPGQQWTDNPVRLNRMAYSARLFNHEDLYVSLQAFAYDLKRKGYFFDYMGKDMFSVFTKA